MHVSLMSHAAATMDMPNPKERRRSPRERVERHARVACPTARPRPKHLPKDVTFCPYDSRDVTTRDLSRHGVGFETDAPMPIGTYQRIELEGDVLRHACVEVKVLRCEKRDDGAFEVAAVFC